MKIWIDGSSRGNPGPGKAVAYVERMDDSFIPHKYTASKTLENTTNNQAEYTSLLLALNYIENALNDIKQQKIKKITIYTDSKLIVGHINDGWNVNANIALVTRAKKMLNELKEKGVNIEIAWIPRNKNLAGIKIENGEIE